MNWKMLIAGAVFWLAIVPAVAGQGGFGTPPGVVGESKDRLSPDRMEELVSEPISVVQSDGLAAGRAAFERLLAAARAAHGARSVEVADLLTSFGVGLYSLGQGSDDRQMREASLPYLEAAIAAGRAAFGDSDVEVAVALNSYADAQIALHEDDPPRSADAALEEAYRIRLNALGPSHAETLASLRYLARLRGLPSRTHGDRARIEAVAGLYRQLIANASNDQQMTYLSAPYGRTALARMYARNGMAAEAREQLRLGIEQAQSWEQEERCIFAATETADVEDILAGKAVGRGETLLNLDAIARCSRPEDNPAREQPAIAART